jgi:hypothetical protein
MDTTGPHQAISCYSNKQCIEETPNLGLEEDATRLNLFVAVTTTTPSKNNNIMTLLPTIES